MLWQIERLGLRNQNLVDFSLLFQTVQGFRLFCRRRNSIALRKPLQKPHWMVSQEHGDENEPPAPSALETFAEISLSHCKAPWLNSKQPYP